jgi:hypothetical protein
VTARSVATPSSRRAVLAAGLGGVLALVAQALGRPIAARAADGAAVTAGSVVDASHTTGVNTTGGNALQGVLNAGSYSQVGSAVYGEANGSYAAYGVYGKNTNGYGPGVLGEAGDYSYGVEGKGATGVYGHSSKAFGTGVVGQAEGADGRGGYFNGSGTGATGVWANSPSGTAVFGASNVRAVAGDTTAGVGVQGRATSGSGVWGESNATGVVGRSKASSTGVFGYSGGASDVLPGASGKTGVFGYATQDAGSYGVVGIGGPGHGVYGEAGTGRGVHGWSNTGVGVHAEALSGTALRVTGKATFSRSGKLGISAGHSTVAKTGVPLSSSSLVLAVLQTNRPGIYVRAVVPNVAGSSFTVYLNAAVPAFTYIAWFVIG